MSLIPSALLGDRFIGLFRISMWLEFTYTGSKDDYEKFEVFMFPPSHLVPSPHGSTQTIQIHQGCIRLAEEVLGENPQLQIMRDPPPLIGKRIRYVTVFHFEEEGKPRQSFLRARSWELPESLDFWKDRPTGWEDVYEVIERLFGGAEEEIVLVVPMDAPVAQRG